MNLGLSMIDYIIIIIGILLMLSVSLVQRKGSVRERIDKKSFMVKFCIYYILIFSILLFGAYSIGYDASQFIYNQF